MTTQSEGPKLAFRIRKSPGIMPGEVRVRSQDIDEWVVVRGPGVRHEIVNDAVVRECLCTDWKFHKRNPSKGDVRMYRSASAARHVAFIFGGTPARLRRCPVQPQPEKEEPPLDWHPTCNGSEMMPTEDA